MLLKHTASTGHLKTKTRRHGKHLSTIKTFDKMRLSIEFY